MGQGHRGSTLQAQSRMSKLLIDDYPLMVLPKLAVAIGLNEAIILQQVHYWTEGFKRTQDERHLQDGHWWVWNTYEGWQENFPFWSTHTVRRTVKSLRDLGLLVVGNYNRKGYDRTTWYRVDYDVLSELEATGQLGQDHVAKMATSSGQNGHIHVAKMTLPIPETTSETTPETTPEGIPAVSAALLRDMSISGLSQRFEELSRIPPPRRVAAQRVMWRQPIGEVLDMCNGDKREAWALIEAVFRKYRNDNLTVASPQSLLKGCAAERGNRLRSGPTDDGQADKLLEFMQKEAECQATG